MLWPLFSLAPELLYRTKTHPFATFCRGERIFFPETAMNGRHYSRGGAIQPGTGGWAFGSRLKTRSDPRPMGRLLEVKSAEESRKAGLSFLVKLPGGWWVRLT